MLIVIPMAGLSRRFSEAGFTVPKYMLKAGGISLFQHAVRSFESLYNNAHFLFVYRDVLGTAEFITRECDALGILNVNCVDVSAPTRGQAETVAIGLRKANVADNEPIIIFNIDTIRFNYSLPRVVDFADGYLEVFSGEGDSWSFVGPAAGEAQKVEITTEKRRISNLCSTGLYYFRRCHDFLQAFDEEVLCGPSDANEFYVAPLYNRLIRRGLDVRYEVVASDEVVFSGIPAEYKKLCTSLEGDEMHNAISRFKNT